MNVNSALTPIGTTLVSFTFLDGVKQVVKFDGCSLSRGYISIKLLDGFFLFLCTILNTAS
jgi:hypothetical protein